MGMPTAAGGGEGWVVTISIDIYLTDVSFYPTKILGAGLFFFFLALRLFIRRSADGEALRMVTTGEPTWYVLYLITFLPFCPGAVGITLSWSIWLGYRVLIEYGILNQWTEDTLTPLMIWGGPIAALIFLKFYQGLKTSPDIKPGKY
jgi:hypothetical protein